MQSRLLSLLLLADGRFPAGGHAHSAGVEAAVADGRIDGVLSLTAFARGRLWTTGLNDAAVAAATADRLLTWTAERARHGSRLSDAAPTVVVAELDAEADARIAPPPLRSASRRLGRQLIRAAERCWPVPVLAAARAVDPLGPHQAVAIGAAAVAAGLDAEAAAVVAVHHALATPVQAALRLLGLDPFDAAAVVGGLGAEGNLVVRAAVTAASGPATELPCGAGPMADIAAVHHAGSDRRLFVT